MNFFKMLKKMRRTQFFDGFVYADNLLIISILCVNLPFPPLKSLKSSLSFRFLFRHSSKMGNYTLLNISTEANFVFLGFPVFSNFQRTVFFFAAHSGKNCSALQINLQCAVKKKTVR